MSLRARLLRAVRAARAAWSTGTPGASLLERHAGLLLQQVNDAVLVVSADGTILDANAQASLMYGRPREALVGSPVRSLRPPSTAPEVEADMASVRGGGRRFETLHVRTDGQPFAVEVSSRSMWLDGAELFVSVIRDLSARRAAEEAARLSDQTLRAAFQGAGFGLIVLDAQGRVHDNNPAAEALLGAGPGALVGRGLQDLLHPQEVPLARGRVEDLRRGGLDGYAEPRRFLRRDGTVVHTLLRVGAVRSPDGALRYALGVLEDLTERRVLEAEVAVADRLTALGSLAASVAHDVASPLAALISDLAFARRSLERGDADHADALAALADAAASAALVREVVCDLRDLSRADRPWSPSHGGVDARRLLVTLGSAAAGLVGRRARFEVSVPELPRLAAGGPELTHLVLRLITSAAQAIDGTPEENLIRLSAAHDGDRLEVRVLDTGRGARAFGPGAPDRTARGSVLEGYLVALGGAMDVAPQPGGGCAVTLRVPLPPGGAEPPASRARGQGP